MSPTSQRQHLSRQWQQLHQEVVSCQRCDRLIKHCRKVALEKRAAYRDHEYWGKPVPNFGAPSKILVVGLAPGAHGANRTGRMFTGDRSGDWLYRAMYNNGLANQPESTGRDDGLKLTGCAVTNVCSCAPPDNKPATEEIANCQPFFQRTIELCQPKVFVALGGLAWRAVVRYAVEQGELIDPSPRPKFGHGAKAELTDGRWLLGCYHPSQQNTFTGRLTEPMIDAVFKDARRLAGKARKHK